MTQIKHLLLFAILFMFFSTAAHAEPRGVGDTDRGARRPQNEDSILVMNEAGLFSVADGMGGHAAGEVASLMAVKSLEKVAKSPFWNALTPVWPASNTALTTAAYHVANAEILHDSLTIPMHRGMGNTLVTAVVRPNGVDIINVGDSRAYYIHEHAIKQITKDQSLVQQLIDEGKLKTEEEIANFPYKNIITQAMGTQPQILPVLTTMHPVPGDIILLCSDGLTNELTDAQILAIIESVSLDDAPKTLIERANSAGGHDNISTVLIQF